MNYRALLTKVITFLGGLYFFLEFVLPEEIGGSVAPDGTPVSGFKFGLYHDQISNGLIAIGAMAVGLGLINLFMVHGSAIIFRRKGWFNSSALLLGLFVMAAVTLQDWRRTEFFSGRSERASHLADFAGVIVADEQQAGDQPAARLPLRARIDSLIGAGNELLTAVRRDLRDYSPELFPDGSVDQRLFTTYSKELADVTDNLAQDLTILGENTSADTADSDLLQRVQSVGSRFSLLSVTWRRLLNKVYGASTTKKSYTLLFDGLFVPLGSAMFSLLGVYIAAAAYRAFRIRSTESGLMVAAAVIVMLGQIPFGVWIWEGMPELRLWLLEVPSSAAFRAIKFGAAVAGLAMAFRMWLSIESESFIDQRK